MGFSQCGIVATSNHMSNIEKPGKSRSAYMGYLLAVLGPQNAAYSVSLRNHAVSTSLVAQKRKWRTASRRHCEFSRNIDQTGNRCRTAKLAVEDVEEHRRCDANIP